jgi:hypothetical protein
VSRWIEFEEKMPKNGENVLLSTSDGDVLHWHNFTSHDYAAYSNKLVAWQYTPKPYKTIECGDEVTTPAGRGVVLYMEHSRGGDVLYCTLVPSGTIQRFRRVNINPTGKRWEKLSTEFGEYMAEVNE